MAMPSESPQDVGHDFAQDRSPGVPHAPGVPAESPVAGHQEGKAQPGVCPTFPHWIELRRRVQARLVRLDQPQEPVALEVAVGAQPLVVAGDPGSAAGSPTAIRQAHASKGGWMVPVIGAEREATL